MIVLNGFLLCELLAPKLYKWTKQTIVIVLDFDGFLLCEVLAPKLFRLVSVGSFTKKVC